MYKAVIGLEVHCELNTNSKMFSSSKNEYNNNPNVNLSVIDLAFPGILPLPNKEGIRKAIKLAMALNCEVPNVVKFDRKNYYYPDLPKGYQITQMTNPFGRNGYLDIEIDGKVKRCGIHQLHLEEDTASMEHHLDYSLLDYNRCGVPLVEIVTEPCFSDEEEVVQFLENLRSIIKYTDVSEASSDKGQLRVDVNISMMKDTDTHFGVRAEIKNINSFNSVKETILYEKKRQEEILSNGGVVIQETRRWVDDEGKTVGMREKVDAVDYKYYVEPNIPLVSLSDEFLSEIRREIPVLHYERRLKYVSLGVSEKDAKTLVKSKDISDYFEKVLELGADAKEASNWITTRLLGYMNNNDKSINEVYMTPDMLYSLIDLVNSGKISSQQAKDVFLLVLEEEKSPSDIVREKGMEQISDEGKIRDIVNKVIDENQPQLETYKSGKTNIIGFFVGQVLKASGGKANPSMVSKILNEEINKR